MQVERRTGSVPGIVFATIRNGQDIQQISSEIRFDDQNHYVSRLPGNRWSVPCKTIDDAILMHAAQVLTSEPDLSPWLDNPAESRFRTPAHRHAHNVTKLESAPPVEAEVAAPYCLNE